MTTKTQPADRINALAYALGCKPAACILRLKALGLADCCTRCGGGGEYSFCQMHGTTCFGCGGSGVKLPKITAKLLTTVREKVAAGGLNDYLDQLRRNAEAKKIGESLHADYDALAADEKAATAAAVAEGRFRPGWHIGTERGFLIRAAAYPALQAADRARMDWQYAKTPEAREAARLAMLAFRQEMFDAVAALVSATAGTEVLDTFKTDVSTQAVSDAAHARVRAMK